VGVHTIGHLAATGASAWVIYCKSGLVIVRMARFKVDALRTTAFLITGPVTLVA
jgi:hypothetical protein